MSPLNKNRTDVNSTASTENIPRQRPQRGPGGGHAMGMPVEKAKDFKGTFRRLLSYIKPQRVSLIVVFIMAILSTVFNILSPKIMGDGITKLFEGFMHKSAHIAGAAIDFTYIGNILLILIGLYVASAFFGYIQQYIMASVSQKIVFNLRNETNIKLSRLPLKFFDSKTHGEILSRMTNDIDNISTTLQQSITQLITAFVTIIGIVIVMLTISPLMTLITLATLPLSIIITIFIAKRSQKYFKEQQKVLGDLNGHVEEMYTGHKIVKAFNYERQSVEIFEATNAKLYNAGWKAQFISGIIMPMMSFVNNIGYVLVCIVGGVLVTRGALHIGDIQAFIQYSKQFSQPIVQAANISNIIQSTIASAERVFEILDEKEESPDSDHNITLPDVKGVVKFDHVEFGYTEDKKLMRDLNIDVKSGQMVAIVGPTGAGKTTLVNLLMRFYEVSGGQISVDDVPITDLKRGDLRQIFGMVLQDTWLFKGSILENIAYGKQDATEEEIFHAADTARADHFIRTLPEGYKTILNEEANNISQGQKQLLTIARALLADPAVLILDEATSSVDTRTELLIQEAMTHLMKGRTSFVIAHRLSTIKGADLILVMNDGAVIEKGTHVELLSQNGFYADLYNSQFALAGLSDDSDQI